MEHFLDRFKTSARANRVIKDMQTYSSAELIPSDWQSLKCELQQLTELFQKHLLKT